MRIIQLPRRFVSSEWGGTETVILQTCRQLLEMGNHTEIYCPNALADSDEETIDSVRIRRFPYFYPYWGLKADAKKQLDKKGGNLFSFSLMRALKRYPDLDLIHLHTQKRLGGIARYVAIQRRIPYVVSLHGGLFDVPTEEARSWTEPTQGAVEWGKLLGAWVGSRRVMDDAAAIICVGQQEQKETQAYYPHKKVIHLPNGVNPERFASGDGGGFRRKYNISADDFVLLVVGRIDPQKNQLFPVQLLPELIKIEPKLHLLLIGHVTNDTYYQKIKSTIAESGMDRRVTPIPGVDADSGDLLDAYHCADLFLLPSIHEPFGIVILEAWAAERPVLASRVGGVPSFVEHRKTGMLFEPNDRESFLNNLQTLVHNKNLRQELARAGKRRAIEEYSWKEITGRLVRIYEEAIDENPLRQ